MRPLVKARFDPALPLSRERLARLARVVAHALGMAEAEYELMVVDDAAMARLNKEFLGLPGPTNVLSFPDEDPDSESLGQIALSADTLAREVFLYGQDPVAHTARLIAHALLHLSGLDHGEEMWELTDKAVEAAARAEAGRGFS